MAGIVVGVEDSKPARAALEWAVRFANAEQLPVTVITVIERFEATSFWGGDAAGDPSPSSLSAIREKLTEMVDTSFGDESHVPVQIDVIVGHPVEELVRASDGADLLVVGSRGAGPFGRLLLGSTSNGVAHHAQCSVTIVKT